MTKYILICNGISYHKESIEIFITDGVLEIESDLTQFKQVLDLLNGNYTNEDISNITKIPLENIYQIVELLYSYGAVLGTTEIYKYYDKISSNPSRYTHEVTHDKLVSLALANQSISEELNTGLIIGQCQVPDTALNLQKLLRDRKSTRNFSNVDLDESELMFVLSNCYVNQSNYHVPSAGGFYPINIYVVFFSNRKRIQRGIYRFDPAQLSLHKTNDVCLDEINYYLNGAVTSIGSVFIYLTSNLEIASQKYSNRSYKYALLEAGHIAQNIYMLTGACSDIGVYEYGGYIDYGLKSFCLNENETILTSLFLGVKNQSQKEDNILYNISVLEKETQKLKVSYSSYELELGDNCLHYYFMCEYTDLHSNKIGQEHNISCGEAFSYEESKLKALAELLERYWSGYINSQTIHTSIPANSKIVGYKGNYNIDYTNQIESLTYLLGQTNINSPVYAPVDLVLYPLNEDQLSRPIIYHANSSGVAGHFDIQKAKQNAVFELVERDALITFWHSNLTYGLIDASHLNDAFITKRLRMYDENCVSTIFINTTVDSIFSCVCIVFDSNFKDKESVSYGIGAAAHFHHVKAIEKSFEEAVFMFESWKNVEHHDISRNEVFLPKDHGIYYRSLENFQKIYDKVKNLPICNISLPPLMTIDDICEKFEISFFLISEQDYEFKVVRAISNTLLPIYFGDFDQNLCVCFNKRFESLGAECIEFEPHFFS